MVFKSENKRFVISFVFNKTNYKPDNRFSIAFYVSYAYLALKKSNKIYYYASKWSAADLYYLGLSKVRIFYHLSSKA